MAVALIIFDCDGVILESVDAKTRAFHRIGLEFGQEAADRLTMYHRMNGGVSRYKKFEWLYEEVLGRSISDEEKDRLGRLFVEYCYDEIERCALVPGVEQVLAQWHTKVPLYVASGAPHEELNVILKHRGLSGYFQGIFGAPPGKAQLLRNILQETGIHPSKTVMVGDSRTDQAASEAVGCLFYGRGEFFQHSGYPWHHDLTQLNSYLAQLGAEV